MTQFTVKPLNDIISDMLLNVLDNIEEVTDANVGSVLRQMLESVAQEISLLYDSLQEIYDGSRVSTATGSDLEQIGYLVGVQRKLGSKATGYVTFIRNTPASSDFTISSGSIVSTQPNTGEEQLRFVVKNNTTFTAQITGETHTFNDGVYYYKLNERLLDSVQSLSGTSGGGAYTFIENTDFKITNLSNTIIVDVSTIAVADDCETDDWTESTDATAEALNTSNKKQGSNALDLGKSGTTTDTASYSKVLGSVVDATDKNLHLYFYIADQTTLNKIKEVKVSYGSGGDINNSYTYSFGNSQLNIGWNFLTVNRTVSTLIQNGFPSISAINFLQIDIVTNNTTDTISSGDIAMDYWFFSQDEVYNGDVIEFLETGTLPDDGTTFTIDYIPLSKEVLCESENIGSKYNVGVNKIVYKVSNIPNIDSINNYEAMTGGNDDETDDALRSRIINSSGAGKATVEALKQALLAVDGVTSVTVDDMPLKSVSAEPHTFITGTDNYKLNFEVAQNNANLVVTGTLSGTPGHTFVNGVDYVLNDDNEIVWQAGGDKPDDSTIFYVDYEYRWLGHVDIFISGTETPLPPTVIANIDAAIADTKAAGIIVNYYEPTVVTVDVTATVTVDTASGYSESGVKDNIKNALKNYINGLNVGEDVYIAEIIAVIQGVDGVINSSVSAPASDVVIGINEIAKAGTITIN